METGIILSWSDINPYDFYTEALQNDPIFYDKEQGTWVVCSYSYCKEVLLNDNAKIPEPNANNNSLSALSVLLIKKLVRLTNNEQHRASRQAAEIIYKSMQSISVSSILHSLVAEVRDGGTFDWVSVVCKKLPVLIVLKGLCFKDDECAYVLDNIQCLVKIMSPLNAIEDIDAVNRTVDVLISIAQKHVTASNYIKDVLQFHSGEWMKLFVCNLIGLLIQSYDAGRGLLCNSLIQLCKNNGHIDLREQDKNFFRQSVIETLRFDPPIHNTRRIADADILIGGKTIRKGEKILIVLAAANLDPKIFASPLCYNISRVNNNDHLTFGLGGHMCLAKHLITDITAETCRNFFYQFRHIVIPEQVIRYEPQLNARLIKELFVTIS